MPAQDPAPEPEPETEPEPEPEPEPKQLRQLDPGSFMAQLRHKRSLYSEYNVVSRGRQMEQALHTFAMRVQAAAIANKNDPPGGVPLTARVAVPLWDTEALAADAASLLQRFNGGGVQFGPIHGDRWKTLNLRSHGGKHDNDRPGPSYESTEAWKASTYIVPVLLRQLLLPYLGAKDLLAAQAGQAVSEEGMETAAGACLQRVRLSVIPPGTNVSWHIDFADTAEKGPMRMHVPIITSSGFDLEISGAGILERWNPGETWLGQFELPHRLCNQHRQRTRVHLLVDIWPTSTATRRKCQAYAEKCQQLGVTASHPPLPRICTEVWDAFTDKAATAAAVESNVQFGQALKAAHQSLFSHPGYGALRAEALAAFHAYKSSTSAKAGHSTDEDDVIRAGVEARRYLVDSGATIESAV